MSPKIVLHPRMSADQVADFSARHGFTIEVDFDGQRLFVYEPPATEFECKRCDWQGQEPRWTPTGDLFQPPIGEVPVCPDCGYCPCELILIEKAHAKV